MTPTPVFSRDAPRLAAIHAEAFDDPWSADAIAGVLAAPGAFALAIGEPGPLVGFVLCRRTADEAEILTLAVRPADRRRGLAATLLNASIALVTVAGATSMFLEVAEDNPAALALYAGAGFVDVGRRPDYYARPAGAVAARILRRDLNI